MTAKFDLEHTTAESLDTTITSRSDPTGSAVEFSLTLDAATDPGAWTPGTWAGSWDTITGKVLALSPRTNSAGFELAEGSVYKLWVRWTMGADVPVWHTATITAT